MLYDLATIGKATPLDQAMFKFVFVITHAILNAYDSVEAQLRGQIQHRGAPAKDGR